MNNFCQPEIRGKTVVSNLNHISEIVACIRFCRTIEVYLNGFIELNKVTELIKINLKGSSKLPISCAADQIDTTEPSRQM